MKTTAERIVERREFIRDVMLADPAISYASLTARVNTKFKTLGMMTRGTVAFIAQKYCVEADPAWLKINAQPQEHACNHRLKNGRVCGVKFKGEKGYSGRDAVKCKRHRRKHISPERCGVCKEEFEASEIMVPQGRGAVHTDCDNPERRKA